MNSELNWAFFNKEIENLQSELERVKAILERTLPFVEYCEAKNRVGAHECAQAIRAAIVSATPH